MIITWMLGSIVFAALVAVAALAAERAFAEAGQPRRVPWLFALAASTAWPLVAGISFLLRPRVVRLPTTVINGQSRSAVESVAARLPSFDAATINGAGRALIAVWAVVSLVLLARLVIGLVRLRRVGATGDEQDVDGMRVLVTESLGPAVYGAINPRIVVPRWLLDLEPALRSLVLAHEHQHRSRGDAAVIVAGAFATALVPWNPVIWYMARRTRLAIELDCDSRVIASLEGEHADRYSKLLLLIAQRQTHTGLVPMLAESNAHLETRITAMNSTQNRRSYTRAVAFAAVAFAAVAVACSTRVSSDLTAPAPISATKAAGLPQSLPESQKAFFEFQVEKPVARQETMVVPKYPDILKQAGVEGEVLAQYVVDETGAVMVGTFKVLKFSHQLFVESIRNALPEMHFAAAEVGGRKVKQLVQQPFVFALAGPRASLEIIGTDSGGAGGKGPRVMGAIVVPAVPVKKP